MVSKSESNTSSEPAFMLACTRPVGISYWPTQVSIKSSTNSCIEFKYNLVLSKVVKVLFDFLQLSTATKIVLLCFCRILFY